ncbi:hypothetical protein M316_0129 [Nitrincola phage 1M3-16]|uniref:head-tail adaptor Ad1 n=1 Tax=Nitrincola phage 1M3-16 TaxID=1472912 RepID=UPI000444CB9E|nr:head-tail adaptor Ad1 [Nitrincola phage 1M3-16]AHX01194.1 hypothetical protein M316_0129 [Nitrincola phage 1M3-16]
MIFKVETGEGLPDSTSYISVEDADSIIEFYYPEDLSTWNELSTEEKERRLMIATQYLDSLVRWNSTLKNRDQALEWPRNTFSDARGRLVSDDSVPKVVRDATAGIALESLSGDLTTDSVKLSQEDFGDSSERYASARVVADNPFIFNLQQSLIFLGIGSSRTTVLTLERA